MSLMQYVRDYTIGNQFWPQNSDGYDGDTLSIVHAGGYNVTFKYTPAAGSVSRGSWNSATGTYDPRYDIITGQIPLKSIGGSISYGYFSIALDRTLPQPPVLPYIHVYVDANYGGAPDEGSYTGQGN